MTKDQLNDQFANSLAVLVENPQSKAAQKLVVSLALEFYSQGWDDCIAVYQKAWRGIGQ